jgi:hypothetical protein
MEAIDRLQFLFAAPRTENASKETKGGGLVRKNILNCAEERRGSPAP